jgi:hypothetical protein
MKKEEFPTFLNEKPTVIFGRTERELLIIACGIVLGYTLWQRVSKLIPGFGGILLGIVLAALCVVLAFIDALVSVAGRTLDEWFFCWLFYMVVPKVYLYRPLEEEAEQASGEQRPAGESRKRAKSDEDEVDPLEEY